ncbi:hypothetical protein BH11PSE7_BH11PSE7_33550 [soil metagenome]
MLLQKTEKARTELRPGVRTLGLRERGVLLMADGNKSVADLAPMFDGQGRQIAMDLIRLGYLQPLQAAQVARPVMAGALAAAARQPPFTSTAAMHAPIAPAAPQPSADAFEGKRSLATTRMFLFDICERMFVRRDPALATRFRDALRQAKDRESMLAASREMIVEIERIAGHERADSISERIAMLLPPESSPTPQPAHA